MILDGPGLSPRTARFLLAVSGASVVIPGILKVFFFLIYFFFLISSCFVPLAEFAHYAFRTWYSGTIVDPNLKKRSFHSPVNLLMHGVTQEYLLRFINTPHLSQAAFQAQTSLYVCSVGRSVFRPLFRGTASGHDFGRPLPAGPPPFV